jgi:hypothetical protein
LDVRSSSSSYSSTASSTSSTGSDNLRKKDSSLDDAIEKLPSRFLRLSSHDFYDPVTHQRTDVLFDPTDGRPITHNENRAPAAAVGDVSTAASVKADYDVVTIHQSITTTDNHDGTRYHDVSFKDGHKATFSSDWVKVQVNRLYNGNDQDISHMIPRIPWSNMTQENLRKKDFMSVSFDDIVLSDDYESYQSRALKILYQYGILLVTCTPTHDGGAGVSALASALSGSAYKKSADASSLVHYRKCHTLGMAPTPQLPKNAMEGPFRTLYGVIWSTHSSHMPDGVSLADSSYGNGALPLHTDMTYYRDPPGLQIFTMVSTAQVGGESIFADGLAVAERMRNLHPKEFDVLCRTTRRYRSIDTSTGWHLEANGPIFKAIDRNENCTDALKLKMGVERWGAVVGVRHNDLDRLPDLPPFHVMEDDLEEQNYYFQLEEAHNVLNHLLASDEFRLEVALEPGETVVVANQRCLHGRKSFLTTKDKPRSIMGCYVRSVVSMIVCIIVCPVYLLTHKDTVFLYFFEKQSR